MEYRNSDGLTFVSAYEEFGPPIVEAQAIGLPTITSNIARMAEAEGCRASLVDPYDERQGVGLPSDSYLRSPDPARWLGDRCRRNVERFSTNTQNCALD